MSTARLRLLELLEADNREPLLSALERDLVAGERAKFTLRRIRSALVLNLERVDGVLGDTPTAAPPAEGT